MSHMCCKGVTEEKIDKKGKMNLSIFFHLQNTPFLPEGVQKV